jgi:hypothetical protein
MTDLSTNYPASKLLSVHNVTNWDHYVLERMSSYPSLGTAIRKGVPFVLTPPTEDDVYPGTNRKMYQFTADGDSAVDAASHAAFRSANMYHAKQDQARKDEEGKLCTFLKSSFSEEAKMTLRSTPAYLVADIDNDSFAMYTIARDSHACATSFAVAQRACMDIFQIQMTTTYAAYSDDLLSRRQTFNALFDPKGKGTVTIDDLFTIALVNGLPDSQFQYMKDRLYAEDLRDHFPKFADVNMAMKTYDLNRQKAKDSLLPPPTAPPGPTVMAAIAPAKPICTNCNKPFNSVISRISGKPFTICQPCSFKKKQELASAPTPVPTPEQLRVAQSQYKKAQATILAAGVPLTLPTTPSVPLPTKPTAEFLNQYIQSQTSNYSLTATTTIGPNPQWVIDTGASLCCTWDPADIVRPLPLPSPIPIGSANGEVLHATHVGASHFSPDLPIHLVPRSAVKLLSLGALTRQGYSHSTGPDHSLAILDSTGRLLCNCPIQPNNIWLFPEKFMSGAKISHNDSFSARAAALPFQVPLHPQHFTKEMIKRATQARDLHHFLCHPSDDALKATLDQGLFSQHSALTGADVDLMARFYGSCIACTIGKLHYQDLHVTSTSSPSTRIGQRVFFDLQLLPSPSIGGNTQALTFIDDYSRFVTVLGAKSKEHDDVVECIRRLIATYNAQGHLVSSFCSDSEPICLSLATDLGLLQADITHTTPDSHCHKVERTIQQIDQKAITVLESIPYHLPTKLILYLKKYCADCINLTSQSTLSATTVPHVIFYKKRPEFNPDPAKALLPFGAVCLIKHTDGQRAALATKAELNIHHVPKATVGVHIGFAVNHPGDNIFYSSPSPTPLIRRVFEVISMIPFSWKPKSVLQQTYITNSNPSYADIILNDDFPQPSKSIDQLSTDTIPAPQLTVSPENFAAQSNLNSGTVLQPAATDNPLAPSPAPHRYPIHRHRIPSHLVANMALITETTASSLSTTTSEKSEFTIKKALLMENYSHAVYPAIAKEMTKMFITYRALTFVDRSEIPPEAVFFRFFLFLKLKFLPDHSFERMSARLCAMEKSAPDPDAETAYAATGDHHLFLLTVTVLLAAAVQGNYLDIVELRRYDIPGAFLQCPLTPENCPRPHYGRLPDDLPAPYGGQYVKMLRGVYGARVSNKIFDEDHTATLLSMGYEQSNCDPRKFQITCPTNPILKVIINTHVDDGGVILTWRAKYDETLSVLNKRYPGTLDESPMDRYLGMGFEYNPTTGALTASMYHSVLKILATFCTASLPTQRTPYAQTYLILPQTRPPPTQGCTNSSLGSSSGSLKSALTSNSLSSWPAPTTRLQPRGTSSSSSESSLT